jgi:hypothetical protein
MIVDANGVLTPDALAAGASLAPSPSASPALQFRVAVTLGGVLKADSRDEASEMLHAALSALAGSLPEFVDLEAQTSVSVLHA